MKSLVFLQQSVMLGHVWVSYQASVCADGPMPATKRKKYFWAGKHREGRTFDTEHVWTFQLLQHFVDMGKYELNMVYKFDLTRNLDGQPLQFMLKDRCIFWLHNDTLAA